MTFLVYFGDFNLKTGIILNYFENLFLSMQK
jgi:hypothetical protein